MDSKTKHRVLGVLVIIGLGVLAYPLLQSGNDMPSEQVLVKAPPFPDQASPLNQGPTPTVAPEPDAAPAAAAPVPAPALPDSSAASENVTPDDNMRQQPDDVITPSTNAGVKNVKAPDITSPSQQPTPDAEQKPASTGDDAAPAPAASAAPAPAEEAAPAPQPSSSLEPSTTAEPSAPVQKSPKVSHQAARHVKAKTLAMAKHKLSKKALASIAKPLSMPRQDDRNGLLKLNQVAWVIQVGTFKEKGSAMHLVNQLRENGYRAFIQQLPSSNGSSTQVFVGPENRQHLARALATQLQDDMKVKGIVISYQPFSL